MKIKKGVTIKMVDFSNIKPDKAQQIITALKDGKINAEEAKKLGLTPQEAEALNKAFSSGKAEIGDYVLVNKGKSEDGKKQYSQTEKKDNASFWDAAGNFVKDNARGIALGALGLGGGALCITGIGSGIGVVMLTAAAGLGLASCDEFDKKVDLPDVNNSNTVIINLTLEQKNELSEAFQQGIDKLLKKMDELNMTVENYGATIVNLIVQNNDYLEQISKDLKFNGKQNKEIIEILTNINSTVQAIESIAAVTNENLVVNGINVQAKLDAILNAIKEGQDITMGELDMHMNDLKNLIKDVINNQKQNIEISADSNLTLDEILKKLDEINFGSGGEISDDQFKQLLEILQSIGYKLDVIIDKFDEKFPDNSQIQASLDRIEQYLKENNDKTEVTNKLLTELLNKYQSGNVTEVDIQKILASLDNIINAINNINVSGGNNENIEKLLDKILAKMDDNTNAIIEAIGNIKIEGGGSGGNIDLSSLEKMMAELIELTKNNNEVLTNIDAKIDLLNVTAEAILNKLDESNKDHKVIIDILNGLKKTQCKGYDDTKLLEILELLSGKLDEILAAIKDHDVHVTVDDIKVTCTCNCGQNHEGILGELDKVLG